MYILTVAPIVRGLPHDKLTYFSKEKPRQGGIITVPVRNREIPALILEAHDAHTSKSLIKSKEFALKKIGTVRERMLWSSAFIRAVQKISSYHASHFGETLISLIPKPILDAYLDHALPDPKHPKEHVSKTIPLPRAIQASTTTRLEYYQQLIRQSFARGESVFVCLPTTTDVERVTNMLSHGIEAYTYSCGSFLTKKKMIDLWRRVEKEPHAILVVGTTPYLSLPRQWSTIIIDEEHARSWKTISSPTIDLRIATEYIAQEIGAEIIMGAPILRPETHVRLKKGEMREFGRIFSRAHLDPQSTLSTHVINPREEEQRIREKTGNRTFVVLSEEAREILDKTTNTKEVSLLLTARTGLSPITRCGDCGTTICCTTCGNPLVIHLLSNKSRIFSCHGCGAMRSPEENLNERCPVCQSWRLEGMGIGTEGIQEEISSRFPERPCFIIDGEHISTPSAMKKILAKIYHAQESSQGPIVIATPMIVPHLESIDHTLVVSLDALCAIPDIRMSERIFALLLSLREKTSQTLLVQTRMDDTSTVTQALSGELNAFLETEITLRKQFLYPPFSTIIKVTVHAPQGKIIEEMTRLQEYLKEYAPIVPPTRTKGQNKEYRMHLLIKLPEKSWSPNHPLVEKLRALPKTHAVEINPDSLI